MRNRLELAKELLTPDGSIFVHLDFNEAHYAKVLLDEVFEEANFKNNIVWCYTGPAGARDFLPRKHDDILFYGRSPHTKFHLPRIAHKSGVHNTGQLYASTQENENYKTDAEAAGKKLEDWWTDIYSTDRYRSEAIGFTGQKPEKLLKRIIEIATDPGDLVLDYHLGTGTTAAVAHKLGRQYIGIEQLDYGDQDAVNRLQDVIAGDAAGITPEVDWKGGGSFVYVELAQQTESLITALQDAQDSTSVAKVLNRATEDGLLRPSVLPDDIRSSSDGLADLPLDEQKRIVAELVDKNRLYVNADEIDDATLGLTDDDLAFTRSFYGTEQA